MQPITILFKLVKSTANFHRFDEAGPTKVTAAGALYVAKSVMPEAPEEIEVVVRAARPALKAAS